MNAVFWVGDSTVAFNGVGTFPQTGIGQGYQLYVKRDVTIHNYARNGASTKSFLQEGFFDETEKRIGEGDFLYIQFGHNDEKTRSDRYTDPYTTYQENLLRMAKTARRAGGYPVLITSLYRRHFDEMGNIKEKVHLDYPDAVLDLAKKEKIACVDLCRISKELFQKTGDQESRRWFMHLPAGRYENYLKGLEDNTHLHYEGAVKMAGLVAEEIKKLGEPYSGVLI